MEVLTSQVVDAVHAVVGAVFWNKDKVGDVISDAEMFDRFLCIGGVIDIPHLVLPLAIGQLAVAQAYNGRRGERGVALFVGINAAFVRAAALAGKLQVVTCLVLFHHGCFRYGGENCATNAVERKCLQESSGMCLGCRLVQCRGRLYRVAGTKREFVFQRLDLFEDRIQHACFHALA